MCMHIKGAALFMKWFFFLFLFISMPYSSLHAKETQNTFKPAWWCRGSHVQTIFGALFRSNPDVITFRERLETPDGDFLDVDWLYGKENSPYVIILHGLSNTSEAAYIRTLLQEIQKIGWRAVCINARGSVETNRLKVMDHSGRTEDLDFVIQKALEKPNANSIYLVGYSAGANKVLRWLEKDAAKTSQVKKAVCVSTPFDLAKTVENLDKGFNHRLYTRLLLKELKTKTLEKEKRFPGFVNAEKVKKANTFTLYDREVTAPLGGFKNEKDYWAQSSSLKDIDLVRIPALLIHAKNDPFLRITDFSLEEIKKSPHLKLMITPDGGHLGFVSGKIPFKLDRWLEKTILDFLRKNV